MLPYFNDFMVMLPHFYMVTYHIFLYCHATGKITIYFCCNGNITIYLIVSHFLKCNMVTYHMALGVFLLICKIHYNAYIVNIVLINNIIEKKTV